MDLEEYGVRIHDLEGEIDVTTSEGSLKNFAELHTAEKSNKIRSKQVERVRQERFLQKIWKKPVRVGYRLQANGS